MTVIDGAGATLMQGSREIREGWLADLLLVDGDPLANVSILQDKSKLLAIMKDGQFAKPPEIRSSRSRFVA